MEDLKQTSLAYYTTATDEIQQVVREFYGEMDPKDVGHVKFKEFAKYMETIGYKHMGSDEFFDELKHPGNDVLFFEDVIALFYIIQSGRPFCGGSCKKFVKGMYFTCVKCFEDTESGGTSTFSVCSQCFANERNYEHEHQEFLDPIVLLHFKRMEALNKHSKSSSTVDPSTPTSADSAGKRKAETIIETSQNESQKPKYEHTTSSVTTVVMDPCSHDKPGKIATNSSLPTSIVPAVNKKSKQAKLQTAIQFGQLVASIGSIAIASQLCTIM